MKKKLATELHLADGECVELFVHEFLVIGSRQRATRSGPVVVLSRSQLEVNLFISLQVGSSIIL